MIPLYDTVRSHKIPFITYLLILANILVFFHETRLGSFTLQRFIFTRGLTPHRFLSDPFPGWFYILTSMFLHGGWLHILSNMWVLFVFGHNVEASMGGLRYLIFYLLAGAAAALLQAYVHSTSTLPMIGASGAIAGILGAYWWISFWCSYGIFICGPKKSNIQGLAVAGPVEELFKERKHEATLSRHWRCWIHRFKLCA